MSDGEICADCEPILTALHDERLGLQETVRRQAGVIGKLRREETDPRDHAQWKRCERIFKVWQRATGHNRSRFTAARFKLALPFLLEYEDSMIGRGIEGLAFDPFTTTRKNGTTQRHDGWHLLFSDNFEEYCNKAPLEWKDNLLEHMEEVAGRT